MFRLSGNGRGAVEAPLIPRTNCVSLLFEVIKIAKVSKNSKQLKQILT